LFYTIHELVPDALAPDLYLRAQVIGEGLNESTVIGVENKYVTLRLPNSPDPVIGDVSRTGFTVHMGGFDWVTYPTPHHLLQKFPEFLPLPQQGFGTPDDEI
jgi:hypothetical protein